MKLPDRCATATIDSPAHWMVKAGELVQPLINLLRERLLAYDIVAMDETRLQVPKVPGKRAESQSYLWVQRGGPPDHPILLCHYDPSRSQNEPARLLEGFSGYLLTDGYEAYGKVCAEYGLTFDSGSQEHAPESVCF